MVRVAVPMFPWLLGSVLSLQATRDATLYESAAGEFANGAGDWIYVGRTKQQQGSLRRGALYFDVAGALPADAEILSAELRVYVSQSISGDSPVGLYPLLMGWNEGSSDSSGIGGGGSGAVSQMGDATWIHSVFPDNLWNSAGGDYSETADALTMVGGVSRSVPVVWSGGTMNETVQDWIDDPGTNNGWLLIGDEAVAGSAKRINSRENPDAATRPVLEVTWQRVPETSTLMLCVLSAMGVFIRRQRG